MRWKKPTKISHLVDWETTPSKIRSCGGTATVKESSHRTVSGTILSAQRLVVVGMVVGMVVEVGGTFAVGPLTYPGA